MRANAPLKAGCKKMVTVPVRRRQVIYAHNRGLSLIGVIQYFNPIRQWG